MNLKKGLLVHFRKQKALFDPFVRQSVHMYAKKVTMFVWAVRQNPWNVHLIPPMGYREMGKSWAEVADAEVHWSHVHLGRHLPDLLFSDCFCKEKKEILKQVLDSVTWETSGDYIVGSHFTLREVYAIVPFRQSPKGLQKTKTCVLWLETGQELSAGR